VSSYGAVSSFPAWTIDGVYAGADVWAEEVTAVAASPLVADSVLEEELVFDDVSVALESSES